MGVQLLAGPRSTPTRSSGACTATSKEGQNVVPGSNYATNGNFTTAQGSAIAVVGEAVRPLSCAAD